MASYSTRLRELERAVDQVSQLSRLEKVLAGRYRVARPLGSGGMATVYLAEDLKHHREVAIKVLKPEVATVLGPERFLREIEIAARLNHPHILPLHDSGAANGFLYYVMPYVDGESLRQKLAREAQLPVAEAVGITRDVAAALHYAHGQGVIHRDIKPENILLHVGKALITDFGIALALSSRENERLTGTGFSIGTPEYMSPEQSRGERELDVRSDIYSLGCVLYEMLVGEPPYTGRTAEVVIGKRLADPVPSPRRLRQEVPEAVDKAVARALAKVPADRFTSAVEFAHVLEAGGLGVGVPVARSMVVLPLANLNADPENEYFADGLTEELITELSKVGALGVTSRTSAMRLKRTDKDLKTIGRELGVRYVLEGSVRRAGNTVRITAQLIDATTDTHLWAESYSGAIEDVFAIQERLARTIVDALRLKLSPEENRRLGLAAVEPAVYDAYLRGRFHLAKFTVEEVRRATAHFEAALTRDPNCAVAHAGLASAWILLGQPLGAVANREAMPRAYEAAGRALAIEEALAEAHAALAFVHFLYHWDWGAAEREFRRAIELNSSSADAHWTYGLFLSSVKGRHDEGIGHVRHALNLDPFNLLMRYVLAEVLYYARRYDDALEECRKALELDAGFARCRWLMQLVCETKGDYETAIAIQREEEVHGGAAPADDQGLQALEEAYRARGAEGYWRWRLESARGRNAASHPLDLLVRSWIHAALGEHEEAMELLEQQYEARSGNLAFLKVLPGLDPLRSNAKFQGLLRRMGLM